MLDHFDKIQKLKDKIDGVPNFRRVPGYKVFVCGQPTKEGFEKALEKACGDKWPKDGPIIWLNMRQEPILYVNGNPVCARPPNKIGEYAELGDVTRESVEKDEAEFQRMLKKKAEDDGRHRGCDAFEKRCEGTPQVSCVEQPKQPLWVWRERLLYVRRWKHLHSWVDHRQEAVRGTTREPLRQWPAYLPVSRRTIVQPP